MASINRLSDIPWKLKYSPEDGSLLKTFYLPALARAVWSINTPGGTIHENHHA